jgi:Xaa-Pro dipeptidase
VSTGRHTPAGRHDRVHRRSAMIMSRGVPFLWLLFLAVSCGSGGQGGAVPGGALYPEEIVSLAERGQEIAVKERRIIEWLRHEELAGILLSTPSNFAWITGGGSSRLGPAAPCPAALFVRDDGRKFVFDQGGWSEPILAGEMSSLGYEIRQTTWFDGQPGSEPAAATLKELSQGRPYASDEPRVGAIPAGREIEALHTPLTEWEIRKYRWLGKSCAGAVGSVCRRIERWWTDRGVETILAEDLLRRSILPLHVRVEADTAVPGTETRKIADYALISVRASRWGLVVAMKRAIHFGPLPPELRQSQKAAARIEAGLWARTVPGTTGAEILEGVIADCAGAGFPGEWRRSAPGGMTGYLPLGWSPVPGSQEQVRQFEAFSWSASIGAFAMEDTLLLEGDRLVILTEIPGWPVIESRALGRIYRLPAILPIDH